MIDSDDLPPLESLKKWRSVERSPFTLLDTVSRKLRIGL
jgi:hypothetical protein